ncbi:Heterokaryon incompatibility protein (HET) domain containing protein [Naviculisporaceae sp. PSN 640]
MNSDSLEKALRRGVWVWCVFSAILPSGGITTAVGLASVLAAIQLKSRLQQKVTAKSITTPPERRAPDLLMYTVTTACGLGLYGTTRLILRRWSPLTVCLTMFLFSQLKHLLLYGMDRFKFNSGILYRMNLLMGGIQPALKEWLVVRPRSQPALVRYPLLLLGGVLVGAYVVITVSFGLIIAVFMDDTRQFRRDARLWLRDRRLELRSWVQQSPVATYLLGNPKRYSHRPLQSMDSIRLLKLLPRRPFGAVRCELVEIPVTDLPAYEAISYTWGQDGFIGRISVEGKALPVTPTVEDLLYQLSSYVSSRFLWIDQICINQSDKTEKESQIPLMRQIYQSSSNVIVWLPGVKEPFKARGMLAFLWHEIAYGTRERSLELVRMYSQSFPQAGWAQLMNIFAHPWFFRVWVFQEAVLAPSITVIANGEPLAWDHLAVFAQLVLSDSEGNKLLLSGPSFGLEEDSIPGLTHFNMMAAHRNILYEGQQVNPDTFTLGYMLGTFAGLRSTLLVDRFYGFLGVLDPDFVARADWLRPDYTRAPEEVYTDVTKHLIMESKDANEILSFAGIGYDRNLPNLPSWVPDWSKVSLNETFRQHYTKVQHSSGYNASNRRPPHQPHRITSPFSPPELTFTTDPASDPDSPNTTLLLSSGHVFDHVHHLSPIHTVTEHNLGEGPKSPLALAAVLKPHFIARRLATQHASNPYPTGQPLDEVFWRTMLGDTHLSRPAGPSLGQGCRFWERILGAQLKAGLEQYGIQDKELQELLEDASNPAPSIEQLVATGQSTAAIQASNIWNGNRMMCSTGRRFCVTRKGYMAIVPPGAVEGDLVCILKGVNTPFVLRECKREDKGPAADVSREDDGDKARARRRVQIVGEAYVHGVMDGEAMYFNERRDEIFEIQ